MPTPRPHKEAYNHTFESAGQLADARRNAADINRLTLRAAEIRRMGSQSDKPFVYNEIATDIEAVIEHLKAKR
jgi:hypothetical protein